MLMDQCLRMMNRDAKYDGEHIFHDSVSEGGWVGGRELSEVREFTWSELSGGGEGGGDGQDAE